MRNIKMKNQERAGEAIGTEGAGRGECSGARVVLSRPVLSPQRCWETRFVKLGIQKSAEPSPRSTVITVHLA